MNDMLCFVGTALRAATYQVGSAYAAKERFVGTALRAATYLDDLDETLPTRFVGIALRAATYRLQAIGGCNMLLRRYRASSSYLPSGCDVPTVGWPRRDRASTSYLPQSRHMAQ